MTRITIIDGHPDARKSRFVHALAEAYAEGASVAHEVRRITVAMLDFPLLRTMEDWMKGRVPTSLSEAQEAIRWAEHLVFLYPLWLGDMPALLKGFLEQVARPGFAFAYTDTGFPKKLLMGWFARVIVTMGMPASIYRPFYRAHSLKSLERNILAFVGVRPARHIIIGSVESSAKYRQRWLKRVRALGTHGN